jgi:hypothetical protein
VKVSDEKKASPKAHIDIGVRARMSQSARGWWMEGWMKMLFWAVVCLGSLSGTAYAGHSVSGYTRGDGTYVAPHYSADPGERSGLGSARTSVTPLYQPDHEVSGFTRPNGTRVDPYHATDPNETKIDNYSTKGNINPYTGQAGTKDPYWPLAQSRRSTHDPWVCEDLNPFSWPIAPRHSRLFWGGRTSWRKLYWWRPRYRSAWRAALQSATAACRISPGLKPSIIEAQYYSCHDINLEIAKVEAFRQQIAEGSKVDWKSVAGFLGDYGIGNAMEKSEAEKTATTRMNALLTLKAQLIAAKRRRNLRPTRRRRLIPHLSWRNLL